MNFLFKKYDSWTKTRILRHVLYWLAWGTLYVVVNYFLKAEKSLLAFVLFELTVVPIKIICSYTIAYYLMPKFLYQKEYSKFLIAAGTTVVFFGVMLFLTYNKIVYPYFMKYHSKDVLSLDIIFKTVELVHISSLVVCIKFFQSILHKEKVENQLQQEKTRAELKFLKNQIQPHFLFNTLNNLYGMVLSKDKNAPTTIVKLSEMLEYMLYDSETQYVPLKEEITQLENYIALERLRYDRKLDFDYNCEKLPEGTSIAPLILQPFIENAFKHGPAQEEGRSFIKISVRFQNSTLFLDVDNTYSEGKMDKKINSGIGLKNVIKRLDIQYGGDYTLEMTKKKYYQTRLSLKLKKIEV